MWRMRNNTGIKAQTNFGKVNQYLPPNSAIDVL